MGCRNSPQPFILHGEDVKRPPWLVPKQKEECHANCNKAPQAYGDNIFDSPNCWGTFSVFRALIDAVNPETKNKSQKNTSGNADGVRGIPPDLVVGREHGKGF